MSILVVNAGSSSLKGALFRDNQLLDKRHLEWDEGFKNVFLIKDTAKQKVPVSSVSEGAKLLFKDIKGVEAVGHRVVHGGEHFICPTPITAEVKKAIEALIPLAPLHNPANLAGIEATEALFPQATHYAVFDTAFHATIPKALNTYPLPPSWREGGVKKYGFHGISHSYCSKRAATLEKQGKSKMVVCHLGAGASLCAIEEGKSVDTTMGFTPVDGLMMASRSGSIDPGIIPYLMRTKTLSADDIERGLNFDSGLLGVSEISEDLRLVEKEAQKGNTKAKLALKMFCQKITSHLGALIATLEGIDLIVFTAGIGEHAPSIRAAVCAPFHFLGLALDDAKNSSTVGTEGCISAKNSKVKVWVIPTNEELEIANAHALL